MTDRLTHEQIRQHTRPDSKGREWRVCPCCSGHLHLFGKDDFGCKGNKEHGACAVEDVARRLWEKIDGGDIYSTSDAPAEPSKPKQPKPSEPPDWRGLTTLDYCLAKGFNKRLLEYLYQLRELERRGKTVVGWSYCDDDGNVVATKLRLSLDSHDTYFEPADPHIPYGLQNPHLKNMIAGTYDLIIAEGETDTHTFGSWGFPVIGISGSEGWLPEYAELPLIGNAARVFVAEHGDEGGTKFSAKILKTLPQALILRPPDGLKDFNELHLKHFDFEDGKFAPHPFIQSIQIAIQAATLEKAMRQPKPARPKPQPMRPEAFYGLAGKIVDLLEPVMETDRASILANVLGCASVLFQHSAHCKVLADFHYPVDYWLTVGQSAVSRKGTTTNAVLDVLAFDQKIIRGLSTGQGLIAALQKHKPDDTDWDELDEDERMEPIAQAALIEISEFAELLAVMKREENTLSAVVRDAWDGKPLAVLTRNQPLRVKNVSLATIAHITRKELLERLTSTDRANGFANRFLLLYTERAKILPRGKMDHLNCRDVVVELHDAIRAAELVGGEVSRDEETEALWAEAYKRLTTRGEDMIDVLLNRGDAHVLRLCLLFALLDKSRVIRKEHLRAALAVWDYCEASVRYVFGEASADPADDRIIRKLESGPLTTGEIRRQVFQDHKTPQDVSERMARLEEQRRVRRCQKEFKTGAREAWELVE